MSDSFAGPQLGIQWQFFQQYDAKRFVLVDGALTLKATGTNPGDSFPLIPLTALRLAPRRNGSTGSGTRC